MHRISREFYQQLKKEFEHLRTNRRKELIESQRETIEQGDDRENDGYSLTSMLIGQNDIRLGEIREVLENCEIIDVAEQKFIDICSTVTINNEEVEFIYTVVEPIEVDLQLRKISKESELGQLLFGKKVGDTIIFQGKSFKITKIE